MIASRLILMESHQSHCEIAICGHFCWTRFWRDRFVPLTSSSREGILEDSRDVQEGDRRLGESLGREWFWI